MYLCVFAFYHTHNIFINNLNLMFSRIETLEQKTGPTGIGRYEYLQQLIVEFNTISTSIEARHQILANLANFAYDPVNFVFLRQLHCIDVFLRQLHEKDDLLIHFALAGLCNIAVDPESRDHIIKSNGIDLISVQLNSPNENIVITALTSLYFTLFDHWHLANPQLINHLRKLTYNSNSRLRNLSVICLENVVPM